MYLNDKGFLKQLFTQPHKITYAKITALTENEQGIETLEGRVTGGSINIDGSSSIQRTCSLTMVGQDLQFTKTYWTFKNKFKVAIGLKNDINTKYPDIVWFEQGIFYINSFGFSQTPNNITVSIQGIDKMAGLNGLIGGVIPADFDFGQKNYYDNNTDTITISKIPLKEIIYTAMRLVAGEAEHNIVIQDLDDYAYQAEEYRVATGFENQDYIYYFHQYDFPQNIVNYTTDGAGLVDIPNNQLYNYANFLGTTPENFNGYAISKYGYGDVAGYRKVPLVYDGELVLKAGDTLVSLFEKIATKLGQFEFFYDVYGRFVFQKKKNYLQGLFSPIKKGYSNEAISLDNIYGFQFSDQKMMTNCSNTPAIKEIKNDFIVSYVSEDKLYQCHCAIDKKPDAYTLYNGQATYVYDPNNEYNNGGWREIIYQMAKDAYEHGAKKDFFSKIGKTGYEQYYIDMLSFWRDIYNPDYQLLEESERKNFISDGQYEGWHKNAIYYPENLNYWIDILEPQPNSLLEKYSIKTIGVKTKVDSKTKVASIFQCKTPDLELVVVPQDRIFLQEDLGSLNYAQLPIQEEFYKNFSPGALGTTAIDTIENLMNQHLIAVENISFTTFPIYSLQPNTLIYVKNDELQIDGDYIVSKLQIPLAYNGTMSITATKVLNSIK